MAWHITGHYLNNADQAIWRQMAWPGQNDLTKLQISNLTKKQTTKTMTVVQTTNILTVLKSQDQV